MLMVIGQPVDGICVGVSVKIKQQFGRVRVCLRWGRLMVESAHEINGRIVVVNQWASQCTKSIYV